MSRPSVDDPGSDTESVLSSSQPPSTLAGAGAGAGSRSLAGGLYSSNASTLNLSVFAGGPTASHPHASSSSPSSPAASAGLLGGFNALSTVLNSPHKRQHPIDPNSSRYPPLPTHKDAEIKRPKRDSVKQYVDEVSKEWDKWTRSRRLGASGSAKTLREKQQKGEGDAAGEASTDAAIAKKGKLPPLSAVPQVFFEEDFNLGNPYTFDVVTERYGAVTASSSSGSAPIDAAAAAAAADPASQSSQPSLDDKLSHYSDLVEQHLLSEISLRSSSFFSALSTLQDLSSASSSTLSVISTLRSDLIAVREQHVKAGLQVVRKQDERRVLVRRMKGVERVKRWCEGKRMVELMVGQGEYEEGLMVIEGLRGDLRPKQRSERKAASASLRDGSSSPALNGKEEHEGLNGGPADEDEDEEEEVDLSQIPAISALVPDLDELEATISGQLEAELVGVLERGLDQQDSHFSSEAATWPLHERVRPLIHGLVRTSGLEQAMTSSYRPLALLSIRHALRKSLQPSATTLAGDGQGGADAEPMLAALFDLLDDDIAASGKGESRSGEAGARAAQRLREMTMDEFAPLLQRVCEGLEAQVARIEVQERGVLSILDELARQDGATTTDSMAEATVGAASHHQYQMPTQISYGLPNTLASQLHASIEAAHILVARLISLRATAHAQLSMREFLGLYDPLMAFVERTERIEIRPRAATAAATAATATAATTSSNSVGMRRLIPLRSTLLNQSKDWLRHFHRVRLEKAARWVEEETWSQAEVPAASVELVRKLVQCASEDAEGWGPSDQGEQAADETEGGETSPTLVIPSEAPSSDGGTAVDAGDRKSFYVVPATLRVLDLTREYTQAVIGMSRVTGTMEIMSREVEFLKQFNSRTCQVVLGAGAMRSAGLKNITAKHLALASQSLSLFIHLIPYLRECVRRHLPDERQAVMLVEFDKLRRDFQEHMFEIHAKLVAIMGDRLGVHCRTLQGTQWNAPLPNAAGAEDGEEPQPLQPNKAIQDLVKETSTLHKVLSKYLHSNVVESITAQVLSAITQRIGTEFARVEVTREGGENAMKRMEADVDYLDAKLGSLKGVERGEGEGGWDVRGLRAVVSSKTPPPPPAQAAAATAGNTSSKGAPPAAAAASNTNAPGSAPSSPVPGASSSPRTGPAAYRSKMFPFGRRAAATQQQQGTPPRSGSPAAANAGSPTLARTASSGGAQGRTSHDTPPSLARTASALGGAGGRGNVDELFAPQQQQQGSAESSNRPSMDVVSLPPSVVAAVPPEQAVVVEEKVEEREGEAKSSEAQEAAEQTTTASTVNEDEGPAIVPGDGEAAGAEAKAEAKDQPGTAEEAQPALHEASAEAGMEQSHPLAAAVDETAATTVPAEPSLSTDSPRPPSPPSHDQPPVAAPAPSPSEAATSPSTPSHSTPPAQEVPTPTPTSPAPTPAPTASASGSSTPTRPARQTLQQRLAEAARKRSAAAASAAGIGIRPSTPPPSKGEEKEVPPPPTPEKDRSRSRDREPVRERESVGEGAGANADAEKQGVEVLGEQRQPSEEEKVAAVEEEEVPETDAAAPAPAVALAEAKDEAAAAADATAQASVQEPPKEEAQVVQEPLEEQPVPSIEEKDAALAAAVDEAPSTSSAPPPVAAEEDAAVTASELPSSIALAKDDGARGQDEVVAEKAKPVEEQQKPVEETVSVEPVSTDSALTAASSGAATPKSTADADGSDNEVDGGGDGGEDEEADQGAAATAPAAGAGGGNGKKSGGGGKKKNKKKKGKK